jgi:hypothetical protein
MQYIVSAVHSECSSYIGLYICSTYVVSAVHSEYIVSIACSTYVVSAVHIYCECST